MKAFLQVILTWNCSVTACIVWVVRNCTQSNTTANLDNPLLTKVTLNGLEQNDLDLNQEALKFEWPFSYKKDRKSSTVHRFCPNNSEPQHRVYTDNMVETLFEVRKKTHSDRVRICVSDLESPGDASALQKYDDRKCLQIAPLSPYIKAAPSLFVRFVKSSWSFLFKKQYLKIIQLH